MDIVDLHRRVLDISAAVVAGVTPADLDNDTPCAGWTLRRLLEHMVGQNHGFAAAADGGGNDPAPFADRPVGDDPAGVYTASVERVTAAFAACDPGSTLWLPEISTARPFPMPLAIRFHLIDYVVHAWDVARSIGTTVEFDDDILAEALAVAKLVPDDESRLRDGAFFRPAVPPVGDGTLDTVLAMLGRSSDWRSG